MSGTIAGGATVALLALLLVALNELDLVTALRMIQLHGLSFELNPMAGLLYQLAGPEALAAMKIGVALAVSVLFLRLARRGSKRIATNGLLACVVLALLGVTSNII